MPGLIRAKAPKDGLLTVYLVRRYYDDITARLAYKVTDKTVWLVTRGGYLRKAARTSEHWKLFLTFEEAKAYLIEVLERKFSGYSDSTKKAKRTLDYYRTKDVQAPTVSEDDY